jgi:macrodomain Ter protein organizer (MatP/YcbG family)
MEKADKNTKKVYASVSKECWKKLRITAVQKDVGLSEAVKDILERAMSKKSVEEVDVRE